MLQTSRILLGLVMSIRVERNDGELKLGKNMTNMLISP